MRLVLIHVRRHENENEITYAYAPDVIGSARPNFCTDRAPSAHEHLPAENGYETMIFGLIDEPGLVAAAVGILQVIGEIGLGGVVSVETDGHGCTMHTTCA